MNSCVTNFRYCEEHGYIPVVDLQNNKSLYLTKENEGKLNAWEFFFEQPAGYSLQDIKHAKNVIINDGGYKYGTWAFDIFNKEKINIYSSYCKKYIRFSKAVLQRYNEVFDKYFSEDDVICGTLCRGKHYTEDRPKNHPIQPDIDDVISAIKIAITKHNCNKIYLATEDKSAYEILKKEFGDMLCSVADFTDRISDIPSDQDAIIDKGVNYAVSVLFLAKSNCLVSGITSGTIAAQLLSDGYEYINIFDLGRY